MRHFDNFSGLLLQVLGRNSTVGYRLATGCTVRGSNSGGGEIFRTRGLCGSQWPAILNAVKNITIKMGERGWGVELDEMSIGFSSSCSD